MSTYSGPNALKYPYPWAKDVVIKFTESYTRGTNFCAKLLGISPGHLRFLLALVLARGNSLKWEVQKRIIKILEDYSDADLARLDISERRLLYKCLRSISEDDEIDARDGRDALDSLLQTRLRF